MANTVYYRIFVKDDHVEFHLSHLKKEVLAEEALSKRVSVRSENALQYVREWLYVAETYKMERV